MEFTRNPYAPDSFLTIFSSLDLELKPGSQFTYINSGYFLLGVIIEHVTGQPYDVVLRKRLSIHWVYATPDTTTTARSSRR